MVEHKKTQPLQVGQCDRVNPVTSDYTTEFAGKCRRGHPKIEAQLKRVVDSQLVILARALNVDLKKLFPGGRR